MKFTTTGLIYVFILLFCNQQSKGWGFWAHRVINHQAVATLPSPMKKFYTFYDSFITAHSIDADKRRYCNMYEGPHHYIDLDHYCQYPCDTFPRLWKDAVARYSADTLNKYGTVPWYISLQYTALVKAFIESDADLILKISSDLGHYVADSYVPLHATRNYDGQLSGQNGIHAVWESYIPELEGFSYNYEVGPAKYIEQVNKFVWIGVLSSASEVDSVLRIERNLKLTFPFSQMYCFQLSKNKRYYPMYSEAFLKEYSKRMHSMVERRMRSSISAIGSLWMSAWVEAGQPDLDKLIGKAGLNDNED